MTGILTNEGTDEQEEIPVRFRVTKSWAFPSVVAAVTFSPLAGIILVTDLITLSTVTAAATIHFTTDGSEPNSNSPIFDTPFTLPLGSQTVKAFGAKEGFQNSPVSSAIYNVVLSQVASVTFSPVPNGEDTDTLITLATITAGATIHFTTDGSTPTILSPVFTAPFTLPFGVQTVKAFAVKVDFADSDETEAIYTVSVAFPLRNIAANSGGMLGRESPLLAAMFLSGMIRV